MTPSWLNSFNSRHNCAPVISPRWTSRTTPLPVIAHHHDFAWERERFTLNAVNDYLQAYRHELHTGGDPTKGSLKYAGRAIESLCEYHGFRNWSELRLEDGAGNPVGGDLMVRTGVKRPQALWRIVDALMLSGLIVAVIGTLVVNASPTCAMIGGTSSTAVTVPCK